MKKESFRILWKHFATSVLRRPLQPFLLVFTILIAVSVSITALNTKDFSYAEKNATKKALYGKANVQVNVNDEESSRFIFTSEVRRLLTEGEKSCGLIYMPTYVNDEAFSFCIITDFSDFCSVYDVNFYQIRELTEETKENSVLLSYDFAQENNIKVGDTVKIKLYDTLLDYVVEGLSVQPFMYQYDVMVDISGIERLLSSNLYLFLDGTDNYPCSEVLIYSEVPYQTKENLKNGLFAHQVQSVRDRTIVASSVETIMVIVILLLVLFSALTIFVVFSILNAQRQEENALLFGVGARPYMLTLGNMTEAFVYWVFGGILGVLSSVPLSDLMLRYVGYAFAENSMNIQNVGLILAVMLVTVEFDICLHSFVTALQKRLERKHKNKNKHKNDFKTVIFAVAIAIVYIILMSISAFSKLSEKKVIGYITLVLNILLLFCVSKVTFPTAFQRIAKKCRKSVILRYATKNISVVESNANTAGIFGLFGVLATVLILFIVLLNTMTLDMRQMIQGDYLVSGAMSKGIENLENDEKVRLLGWIYNGNVRLNNERTTDGFGIDSAEVFGGEAIGIKQIPQEGEVAISSSVLKKMGFKVGDVIPVTIEQHTLSMRICCEVRCNYNIVLFNTNYLDFVEPSFLAVAPKEGVTVQELYQAVSEDLALQNATVLPTSFMVENRVKSNDIFQKTIIFHAVFLTVFSCIGLFNSLLSSYRSRREEFACYLAAGMTPKSVRKLIATEILSTFAFGVLLFLVFIGITFWTVYRLCISVWLDYSIIF